MSKSVKTSITKQKILKYSKHKAKRLSYNKIHIAKNSLLCVLYFLQYIITTLHESLSNLRDEVVHPKNVFEDLRINVHTYITFSIIGESC